VNTHVLMVNVFLMRFHPGPQTSPFRINTLSILLYVFLFIFVLTTIHAFLKENLLLFPSLVSIQILKLSILSLNDSIIILITIVGAIVARNNIAYNFRPYIIYQTSGFRKEPLEDRKIIIKNVGGGVAYIKQIRFRLILDDKEQLKKIEQIKYNLTVDEVKHILDEAGLLYKRHYTLKDISNGYALASDNEIQIFEVTKEEINRIIALDIRIDFKGLLKDSYTKEVFCIPRKMNIDPLKIEINRPYIKQFNKIQNFFTRKNRSKKEIKK
jgi:hypothetical protein